MRFKLFILTLISFGLFNFNCGTHKNYLVNKIAFKNKKLENVIDSIQTVNKDFFMPLKTIYIVKIKKKENKYEVSIALFEESAFGTYISNKKDKALGYLNSNNSTVFVFGDFLKPFFRAEVGKAKKFPYFIKAENDSASSPLEQSKVKNENAPPMLPVVIGRIVWIYHYEDGKMKFVDRGAFPILD